MPIDINAFGSTYLLPWGLRILEAAAILLAGWFVTRFIVRLVGRYMGRLELDAVLRQFAVSVLQVALLLFVVLAALNQVGINTTSLITMIGAAGLAVGLALQDSLSNFASGVLLVVFRPFRQGDFVEAAGTAGIVEEISWFTTVMRTGDNRQVITPNSSIYSGTITNYSRLPTRRIDLVVGVGYQEDLRKVKEILQGLVASDERILTEPEPQIAVSDLADSSVNLVVRPWVLNGDYWPVRFDLTERIKLAFDENGISIPYPQLDVHVNGAS